jgi:hypothetical protein
LVTPFATHGSIPARQVDQDVEADDRVEAGRCQAGRRLVGNGYHAEREVVTAAGAMPVRQPPVNDERIDPATGERQRFLSAILPAWACKVAAGGRGVATAVPARPLLLRFRAGAKFENGVLVERPDESASDDTHAHDALIHRPWLFL